MRHRIHLLLLAATILAPLVAGAASCGGGDDDNSCDGRILSTCTDCTCDPGEQTTCTAFPKGDETSNQRCCVCD